MVFWFGLKKRIRELEDKTQRGFSDVKDDVDKVGRWLKHLDSKDKQLFDVLNQIKTDLSSLHDEVESLKNGVDLISEERAGKQVFKKLPILGKQTDVEGVQKVVQTAVQTGNYYDIYKDLSGNEKLVVYTLLNSDMKLSYEDLALLLGKERSTIRGQINSIKQKSEGLLKEISEKNGKKRVFIPEDIKQKMGKFAKVRVRK
jgi:predicted transcriptional regulator